MSKEVARVDDGTDHDAVIEAGSGSTNVNGKEMARVGDPLEDHDYEGEQHNDEAIETGSSLTFDEGNAVARVDDTCTEDATITEGSDDTFDNG